MNSSLSPEDRGTVKALINHPELLSDLKFDLMLDLAQHNLSGEALAEALRLRDNDPEAAEFHASVQALFEAPPLETVQTLSASVSSETPSTLGSLLEAFVEQLRAFYRPLNQGMSLAEPGQLYRGETPIRIAGVDALLRQFQREDGCYEVELLIPAGSGLDATSLTGYSLKIVDRPDALVFNQRRDGSFVASAVLPPQMTDPNKQLSLVPPPSES